jgi:predicted alpha/beta hydrolase family esterase
MKQVFVIHGGTDFKRYEDFINDLKTKEIDLNRANRQDWKSHLNEYLGEGYEIIFPRMPNSQNAKYAEWKIWFERHFPFVQDDIILIGHSLGALFLVRYLSENNFPKKIKAVLLVAAPNDMDDAQGRWEFGVPKEFSKLTAQGGKIIFYHSKDDKIVPFSELAKYQNLLPSATYRIFEDRGHFNQETFPELVADIKSL